MDPDPDALPPGFLSQEAYIKELERRLAEAEANIKALVTAQIDAVLEKGNTTPLLLREAQAALQRSKEDLERVVAERTTELRHLNDQLARVNEELSQVNLNLERELDERERLEEALRQSNQKVVEILESINDGFMALDREWHFTYVNQRAAQTAGLNPTDLIGQNIWERWPQLLGTSLEMNYRQAMEQRQPVKFEIQGILSGEWYDVNIYPSVEGISIYSVEKTERKRAEDAIRKYAEKLERSNRDLQDFAFVASHDLQEPLRKIQAFGEQLKRHYRTLLGEQGVDYIERMQNAAYRMQRMIDDLMAYSRVTTNVQPIKPVDLSRVALEVISDLETRIANTGGHIELGDLPTVEADPLQMHQLLQNLISNALKFHQQGSVPVVKVGAQKVYTGQVEIYVEDNGIGFEMKHLERIFQPFQRLHGRGAYEGSGIGLAICRRIAERHHGAITARSIPGEGTIFLVRLPEKQTED